MASWHCKGLRADERALVEAIKLAECALIRQEQRVRRCLVLLDTLLAAGHLRSLFHIALQGTSLPESPREATPLSDHDRLTPSNLRHSIHITHVKRLFGSFLAGDGEACGDRHDVSHVSIQMTDVMNV